MIGKITKGTGARGLAEYLLGERDSNGEVRPRAAIVGGTMAGRTPRELAAEIRAFRQQRPGLKNAIVHQSLSAAPGDRALSDAEWAAIGRTWAEGMGFETFVTVCHGDHAHVMASRIRPDGSVVSDSNDYRRSEALVRQIETDFDLQKVEASHLLEPSRSAKHVRAATTAQIQLREMGKMTPSEKLRGLLDEALADGPTVTSLIDRLAGHGVSIQPNLANTGRVNGLAYKIDGVLVTAKAMGRGYTWSNLQQKGLDYDEARDNSALAKLFTAKPSAAAVTGPKRGRPSSGDHGPASRTDGARARPRQQADDRGPAAAGSSKSIASRPRGEAEPKDGRSAAAADAVRRILEGAAAGSRTDRSGGGNAGRGDKRSRSEDAILNLAGLDDVIAQEIERFFAALQAKSYTVGLDRAGRTHEFPACSADNVLKNLEFLRKQNAAGADVYCRPDGSSYILLDGISPPAIRKMKADGVEPAAVLRTASGLLTAWINLGADPTPAEAALIAKRLRRTYGAEPNAAGLSARLAGFGDWRGGRLREPIVVVMAGENFGLQPGVVARLGAALIAWAARKIRDLAHQAALALERNRRLTALDLAREPATDSPEAAESFRFLAGREIAAQQTRGQSVDLKQADIEAAAAMIEAGWSHSAIADAILAASPTTAGMSCAEAMAYADALLDPVGKAQNHGEPPVEPVEDDEVGMPPQPDATTEPTAPPLTF